MWIRGKERKKNMFFSVCWSCICLLAFFLLLCLKNFGLFLSFFYINKKNKSKNLNSECSSQKKKKSFGAFFFTKFKKCFSIKWSAFLCFMMKNEIWAVFIQKLNKKIINIYLCPKRIKKKVGNNKNYHFHVFPLCVAIFIIIIIIIIL